MNKRSWSRLAVLLVLLSLLGGCGSPSAPDGSAGASSSDGAEDRITLPDSFALPYDASRTLDPITCADGMQQTVGALLYEGLFELDAHFQAQPRLCSSYRYEPESLRWIFVLRSGVTFSDGSALTAADAAAALNRARTSARYQSRLSDIKSVSAAGDTLTVLLNRANAALPQLLDIPIVKSGTESQLIPLGTGPYAYAAEPARLTARTNWWRGASLPLSEIRLTAVSGADAMLYRFSGHDVQLIVADLTGSDPVSATGSVCFQDADTTLLQYVGVNTRKAALGSAALRRALWQGIDRTSAVSSLLSGHGKAAQFPISPLSPCYPADLEQSYSPGEALTAAEAAGLPKQKLTMLVNEENPFKVSMANYIVSLYTTLGLNIELRVLAWDEYTAALQSGNFDFYYGEVRLSASWDLRPLVGTGGSLNYGGWSDPELDTLLAACAAAENQADALHSVCSRLQETCPILPVCFKTVTVLSQEGVLDGLQPTASNPFYSFSDCTVHLSETDRAAASKAP